jgi:uncharacterized protein YecT (DUF1311 family)
MPTRLAPLPSSPRPLATPADGRRLRRVALLGAAGVVVAGALAVTRPGPARDAAQRAEDARAEDARTAGARPTAPASAAGSSAAAAPGGPEGRGPRDASAVAAAAPDSLAGWSAARATAADQAACEGEDRPQREVTACWAERQRVRTDEALAAYAAAARAVRGRPAAPHLAPAFAAWRRYRDATCALAGAAWAGGSAEPATEAQCRAQRAAEWTEEMAGVRLAAGG